MAPNGFGRDWERWRGSTDERAAQHEEELRKLWDWKQEAADDLAILKTKVAGFAAVGGIAGGAIVAFIQYLLR